MVIEVLFASNEIRTKALRHEIKYKDTTYLPLTTTTDPAKYTIISLSQMALIPENERIASFRHWVNAILTDAKATHISEHDILYIWLKKDATGIYRGSGTVVLKGYDSRVAELKENTTRPYMNAPNYPNPRCHIQLSYMCCNRCKILDDHNTVDCTRHPAPSEQQGQTNEQSTVSSSNSTRVSKSNTPTIGATTKNPITIAEQATTSAPKVIPATIDLDSTERDEDTQQKKNKKGGRKRDKHQEKDNKKEIEEDDDDKSSPRPGKRMRWTISRNKQ